MYDLIPAPGPSGVWEKHFPLISFHSASGKFHFLEINNTYKIIIFYYQEATVLRDGEKHNLNAEKLVMGDIIFVKFGDRVPADIRVLEARGFKVTVLFFVWTCCFPLMCVLWLANNF